MEFREDIKTFLVKKVAKNLERDIDVVERIVDFQFKHIVESMKDKMEVEISGFGRFYLSPFKLRRRYKVTKTKIEELEALSKNANLTGAGVRGKNKKLESFKRIMEYLQGRLDKDEGRL